MPDSDPRLRCAPGPFRRVLVIALSGIGDTVIATALLRDLRHCLPLARIEALVFWPGSRGVLETNPDIDRLWQRNFSSAPKLGSLRLLWGLRRQRFDASVNVHTQGRRAYRLIAGLAGARARLSHEYEGHRWADRRLTPWSIPQDYTIHSVENNRRLLPLLGLRPPEEPPLTNLHLTATEERFAENWLAQNGIAPGAPLGVHIGSGGTKNLRLKRWPLPRWIELCERLSEQHPNLPVLFFGGPDENAAHQAVRQANPSARFLFPTTRTLREAAAIIQRCRAFLSVDTSLMHAAAAVRAPRQFVIEAPTLNPTNLPLNSGWTLIPNRAIGGRHLEYYRYDGRPIRGTDAELEALMATVTAGEVLSALAPAFAPETRS